MSLCEQRAITHAPCDEFRRQRDAIAIDVRERAWDPTLNSYTAVLGTTRMDATLLLLAWYGFEHAESPRMRSTYERVRSRLGAGPLLYRYLRAVPEGAFGICSFWEVEYLALRGDLDVAAELFDRLLRYRNDVGLYSEEIDPRTGEPLGNFPQAFTHIGLINAAVTLQQASTGKQPLHHRQPSTAGKRSA